MEYIKFNKEFKSFITGTDLSKKEIEKLYEEQLLFLKKNRKFVNDSQDKDFILDMIKALFDVGYFLFINHTLSRKMDRAIGKYADILNNRFNMEKEALFIKTIYIFNKANILLELDLSQANKVISLGAFHVFNQADKQFKDLLDELHYCAGMLLFESYCIKGMLPQAFNSAFDLLMNVAPSLKKLGEEAHAHILQGVFADLAMTLYANKTDLNMALGFGEEVVKIYKNNLEKYHHLDDALICAELYYQAIVSSNDAKVYNIVPLLYKRFYDFIKSRRIMSRPRVTSLRRRLNKIISDDILNLCYRGIDAEELYNVMLASYKAKTMIFTQDKSPDFNKVFKDEILPILEKILKTSKVREIQDIIADAYESYGQYLMVVIGDEQAERYYCKAAGIYFDCGVLYNDVELIGKGLVIANFVGEYSYARENVQRAIKIWMTMFSHMDKLIQFETYETYILYATVTMNLTNAYIDVDDYTMAMLGAYNFFGDLIDKDIKGDRLPIFDYLLAIIHFNLGLSLIHTRGKGDALSEFDELKHLIDHLKKQDVGQEMIQELDALYQYGTSFIYSGAEELKLLKQCSLYLNKFATNDGPAQHKRYIKFCKDTEERIEILTNYADEA